MTAHSIFARNSRRRGYAVSASLGVGDGANTMATDSQTQTEAEQTVTKKVDIVCYLHNPGGLTRRQLADEIADGRDMFEREEVEKDNRDVYIEYGTTSGKLYSADPDELERLDTGDLDIRIEGDVDTEQEFVHDPVEVMRNRFVSVITDSYDESVLDEQSWTVRYKGKVLDDDWNRVISYRYEFERIPMLKHKDEITPDDMYVDPDDDFLALKVRAKIVNMPRDEFEIVNDELLGSAMTALAKDELVDRVRIYDCESKTKEQGVCFNI